MTFIDKDMVADCFEARRPDSHKGDYGHLLAVCGSVGMAGAAALAMNAALRCGVGYVTGDVPKRIYPIVSAAVPEAVFTPWRRALPKVTAVLVGCGLGRRRGMMRTVVEKATCPLVIDGDGINAPGVHKMVGKTVILTPHPGEMARLCGVTVADIQRDREGWAQRTAEQLRAVLVLKGHHTLVAAPGCELLCNPTGNPGMAVAGSGDTLAGMIAAFAAQGMPARDAAMCGVYLHGAAGDLVASRRSQHSLLPRDIADTMGELFLELGEH